MLLQGAYTWQETEDGAPPLSGKLRLSKNMDKLMLGQDPIKLNEQSFMGILAGGGGGGGELESRLRTVSIRGNIPTREA